MFGLFCYEAFFIKPQMAGCQAQGPCCPLRLDWEISEQKKLHTHKAVRPYHDVFYKEYTPMLEVAKEPLRLVLGLPCGRRVGPATEII